MDAQVIKDVSPKYQQPPRRERMGCIKTARKTENITIFHYEIAKVYLELFDSMYYLSCRFLSKTLYHYFVVIAGTTDDVC